MLKAMSVHDMTVHYYRQPVEYPYFLKTTDGQMYIPAGWYPVVRTDECAGGAVYPLPPDEFHDWFVTVENCPPAQRDILDRAPSCEEWISAMEAKPC